MVVCYQSDSFSFSGKGQKDNRRLPAGGNGSLLIFERFHFRAIGKRAFAIFAKHRAGFFFAAARAFSVRVAHVFRVKGLQEII